ncbi:hypothetical protein FLT43_07955 [Paenibacillus thiaminolyticus]|uniref:Transposase DDE domain-containing protein n=1 Tax=Paenibacillus thiaminolyticus TaxID=49283 RepID=A0AAP9DZT3_PANTH|nr:hypothetical protein FLT43_07955 [Paenibacillus thiaminolyticus]
MERSFADAKRLHWLRYCRFRGKKKLQQALMTAICQNVMKIATTYHGRAGSGCLLIFLVRWLI